MSRMKPIAVLAAALAAALAAGCGGSPSSDSTSTAAQTGSGTTPTAATTDTQQTDTSSKDSTKTSTEPVNISDAEINKGGYQLKKAAKLTAANGGVLTITFKKVYDPVHSIGDYDPAPDGMKYVGVTLEANYEGNKEGVTSNVAIQGEDGSVMSQTTLADPDCGRNLNALALLGTGDISKRGCVVAIGPKGVKPKTVIVVLNSGKDHSQSATAKVPL